MAKCNSLADHEHYIIATTSHHAFYLSEEECNGFVAFSFQVAKEI